MCCLLAIPPRAVLSQIPTPFPPSSLPTAKSDLIKGPVRLAGVWSLPSVLNEHQENGERERDNRERERGRERERMERMRDKVKGKKLEEDRERKQEGEIERRAERKSK